MIDLAPLREVFESDDAALMDFVVDSLHELETSLDALAGAISNRDEAACRQLAHALKGASANIGAHALAAAMAAAERAAEARDWHAMEDAYAIAAGALRDALAWANSTKAML